MPRLFIAVWPPAQVVAELAAFPRPDVGGLRWTRAEQWHVTVRFLGAVDTVEPVAEAVAVVARRARPVTATIGPAVGRFAQRVLHLPVAGLGELADLVVAETAGIGQPPEDRPFAGHITLARVGKTARGVDLRPLVGARFAADWPVTELTLVESRLSAVGARYEVVARFPLAGSAPN